MSLQTRLVKLDSLVFDRHLLEFTLQILSRSIMLRFVLHGLSPGLLQMLLDFSQVLSRFLKRFLLLEERPVLRKVFLGDVEVDCMALLGETPFSVNEKGSVCFEVRIEIAHDSDIPNDLDGGIEEIKSGRSGFHPVSCEDDIEDEDEGEGSPTRRPS
jgi:hypothetical protein